MFAPDFPFFQWAHPPDNLKPRNANRLFVYFGSGIRGTLHSHVHDKSVIQLTPSQAARALLLVQSFSIAGGNSGRPGKNYRHTPALRQTNFIIHGQSLFETLWLMLFPVESMSELEPFFDSAVQADTDCPVWERDHPENPSRTAPEGVIDSLTYPARLIRLIPNGDGTVAHTIFSQGLLSDNNVPLFDPMAAVRAVKHPKIEQPTISHIKMPNGFLSEFSMFEPESTTTHSVWPVYRRWLNTVKQGHIDPRYSIFNAVGVKTGVKSVKAAEILKIYNHFLPLPGTVFLERTLFQFTQSAIEYFQLRQEFGTRAIKTGLKTLYASKRPLFAPAIECFHQNVAVWMSTRLPALIMQQFDPTEIDTVFRQIFRQCITNFPTAARAIAVDRYRYLCKQFSPAGAADE